MVALLYPGCYILELSQGERPDVVRYDTDNEQKVWLKTNADKQPAIREMVVDSIMGVPQGSTKYGRNFGQVPGGIYASSRVYDSTSHLRDDFTPLGGNVGYLDNHVDWRRFEPQVENGVAVPRYGNSPGFFW